MKQRRLQPVEINRNPLVTHVYEEIRRAILERQLGSGERLVETRLAEQLGVSRTPVREAISRLEVEGFVTRLSTGGVVVENIVSEIVEIYGLRKRLEGYAATLAVERATDHEIEQLITSCDRISTAMKSASIEERALTNRSFHEALAQASHSPRLVRLIDEYYRYSQDFLIALVGSRTESGSDDPMLRFYDQSITDQHQEQHRNIVSALQERDAAAAEARVHEHIESVLSVVHQMLRERESRDRINDFDQ